MDPIADILLFVIAVAVSILAAFAVVALYYFLKIVGDVRAVTRHMRKTTTEITDDIEHIRENVKTGEEKIKSAISFLSYFLLKKKRKKATKKS